MQPYTLIAVGGSGLWAALHLALRAEAEADAGLHEGDEATKLPQVLVMVDQNREDVKVIRDALHSLAVAKDVKVFHAEMAQPPGIYGQGATRISESLAIGERPAVDRPVSTLAHMSLELDSELDMPTKDGFFGQPRLTSWWYQLFGMVSPNTEDPGAPRWLSMLNDEKERRVSRTEETNIRQLVLVGSVTGGTGAGLFPSLMSELSGLVDEGTGWRYDFHVIGLLPWFQLAENWVGPPTTERLRANAVRGTEAAIDVVRRLSKRIDGCEATAKPTTMTLIGGVEEYLGLQPAIKPINDAAEFCRRRAVAPVFDAVADAITHRLAPLDKSKPIDVIPKVGFLRSPVFVGSAKGGSVVWDHTAASRVLAAHRAKGLADPGSFPFEHAAMLFGRPFGSSIQRAQGFGDVLSEFIAGALGGGGKAALELFKTTRDLLKSLAEQSFEHYGRLPLDESKPLQALLDPKAVIAKLDRSAIKSSGEMRRLSDTTGVDVKTIRETIAPRVAERLWQWLIAGKGDDVLSELKPLTADWNKQVWLPANVAQLAQAHAATPARRGQKSRTDVEIVDYSVAHGVLPGNLQNVMTTIHNSLGGNQRWDTEGWAEALGHYQAVAGDLRSGNVAGMVTSTSWRPYREASKLLIHGLILGELELQPVPVVWRERVLIPGDLLHAHEPRMIVDSRNPSAAFGLVIPSVGFVPSPRLIRLAAGDEFIGDLEQRIIGHGDVMNAQAVALWFISQKVPQGSTAGKVARAIFDIDDGDTHPMPATTRGYPICLPYHPWTLDGHIVFLPRLATEAMVETVAKLASADTTWTKATTTVPAAFVQPLASRPDLKIFGTWSHQVNAFANAYPPVPATRLLDTLPFRQVGW